MDSVERKLVCCGFLLCWDAEDLGGANYRLAVGVGFCGRNITREVAWLEPFNIDEIVGLVWANHYILCVIVSIWIVLVLDHRVDDVVIAGATSVSTRYEKTDRESSEREGDFFHTEMFRA